MWVCLSVSQCPIFWMRYCTPYVLVAYECLVEICLELRYGTPVEKADLSGLPVMSFPPPCSYSEAIEVAKRYKY